MDTHYDTYVPEDFITYDNLQFHEGRYRLAAFAPFSATLQLRLGLTATVLTFGIGLIFT